MVATASGAHRPVGWIPILLCLVGCGAEDVEVGPRPDYSDLARDLTPVIEREMQNKSISAVSIALVDDQEVVWARGFGYADPVDSVSASAGTVYRVGSVSKLFTDIGIMQLVEAGQLDLDVPVTDYLSDFRPINPFGKPITLRQLMSHRSGLVREPPIGNYFDPSGPALQQTVQSLNGIDLVYEPETNTKYSNAAIATVGYVLEETQGEPFSQYLERTVLDPLGMVSSAFEPKPAVVAQLAKAYMWTYDGREFEAPTFQLGMAPAGSMYSSVEDLAGFMSVMFEGGRVEDGAILESETLEEMWTPQLGSGYGIGFAVSEMDGHRRVGHGGAIYGFATELGMLPDEKLGAVVVATKDVANSVVRRIADAALQGMVNVREGQDGLRFDFTEPVPADLAAQLPGKYGNEGDGVVIEEWDGRFFATMEQAGFRAEIRALDGKLMVDDVLAFGTAIEPLGDAVVVSGDTLAKRSDEEPAPVPARWRGLIGEYGWDHNTLYVLERGGSLYALIEWFFLYPLEELSRNEFAFPSWGLYEGERLVFGRDPSDRATHVVAASVRFDRRSVGPEDGATFRINPLRPVDELRGVAQAAEPPNEQGEFTQSELVEIVQLDPSIRLDIRYATTNNFMSAVFYREPRAFLQRQGAEALVRVHEKLKEQGFGLLIHDAYRPWFVTKMFWDATPADMKIFVADPSSGSRHNRGAAVDLTLYDLETGEPVVMTGGYDEFSHRSYARYPGGTGRQRWLRDLLREAMEDEGFSVYPFEWWHFDYQGWSRYRIHNETFDMLGQANE
ncbi:MAG: serine hydrolase [Gemmatimonadales bacterium]|jgi:CubicO group peptidase (beta-lactamase class C family)/D-alanyl-D-alanine dipeptidase